MSKLKEVFSGLAITEVEITSGVRKDYKGSFHYSGEAIDIHSVKYSSGKKIYFHALNAGYNALDDGIFFNTLKSKFGDLLQEYISPAVIKTSGSDSRANKYRYSKAAEIQAALKTKSTKGKYDVDSWHLDHLHLAIAKRFSKKQIAAASGGGIVIIILGAAGYWYYKIRDGK